MAGRSSSPAVGTAVKGSSATGTARLARNVSTPPGVGPRKPKVLRTLATRLPKKWGR